MANVIESFGRFCANAELRILRMETAINELGLAHHFLRIAAHRTLIGLSDVEPDASWGAAVKRRRVELPLDGRPRLVEAERRDHNLSELMNICATVERLIDAMRWANTEGGFSDYEIECCHPSTGNNKQKYDPSDFPEDDPGDNDLVLLKSGKRVRFEVSDISGRLDTNRKIPKDLKSLGVGAGRFSGDLRFLVVPALTDEDSRDDGHWLEKLLKSKPRLYSLDPRICSGSSLLLKVHNRMECASVKQLR